MALTSLFDYRCAPPTTVIKSQGPQLQSICTDETCPLAENATCDSYEPVSEPSSASSVASSSATSTASYPTGHGNATTTGPIQTSTSTLSPTTVPTAGAAINRLGLAVGAAAGGIAAFLL